MTRRRPLYVLRETNRHGSVVYYFRRGKGKRVRLHGEYGGEQFMAEYLAALAGEEPPSVLKTKHGSLAWLIERYRESSEWSRFSMATKRQRENILKQIIASSGEFPISSVKRSTIVKARDKRASTPAQANHFLKVLRSLFKWASEAGYARDNPTLGVSFVRVKTAGHRPWTPEDIAAFEARWPVGTRERLAMAILAYTGLRRGDAVRLGRQHLRNGVFELTAEKTGERLTIPLAPELARIIAATPSKGLTYLETAYGRPVTKAGFGNWFREACNAAGVPGTAHGLRKALASLAAENGATDEELDALFGWRGKGTSSIYTKAARRSVMARSAMAKALANGKKG